MSSHSSPDTDPARAARIAARLEVDRALIRAWPGLTETLEDGWLMRFSGAYTRWGNAVFPLELGHYPLEKKIEIVEKLYVKKQQRPMFRMTMYTQPEPFDDVLADGGYARVGRTSVLTFDLGVASNADAGRGELTLEDDFDAGWMAMTNTWLNYDDTGVPPARAEVFRAFAHPTRYATLTQDGKPVAAAVFCHDAEAHQGFVFATLVNPHAERAGHRAALLRHLVVHARTLGLHQLITETDMKDPLVKQLTERLGFEERLRYWFRAKMFF